MRKRRVAASSQFADTIVGADGLGLDLRAAATFFGVTEFTARRWSDATMNPPGTVRVIVEALRQELGMMPPDVRARAVRLVRERVAGGVGEFLAEALGREAARVATTVDPTPDTALRDELADVKARLERLERKILSPAQDDSGGTQQSAEGKRVIEL